MKVKELIKILEALDQEAIVIISSDGEGNSKSPFSEACYCAYKAENAWSGETGLLELTEELKAEGYTEEDVLENAEPAVVLYPTN